MKSQVFSAAARMGIVLKGFDRALHRNVAIKVLDPALAGAGAARQRFAREGPARIATISHEHVVPVYGVDEHAGLPYFVMEYVAGGSLERRLKTEGHFDAVSIVRIGLQAAQALAAAHSQGLVHRDIKPGNILIDRGTDRVRVADFGLARVANDVSCTHLLGYRRNAAVHGPRTGAARHAARKPTCSAWEGCCMPCAPDTLRFVLNRCMPSCSGSSMIRPDRFANRTR